MSDLPRTPETSTSLSKAPLSSGRRRAYSRSRLCDSAKQQWNTSFRSPVRVDLTDKSLETSASIQTDIDMLKRKLCKVDDEIELLKQEGFKEEELNLHITKMHEYNELKDTGQMLLGKLAELECVPVKDLYQTYGLELED